MFCFESIPYPVKAEEGNCRVYEIKYLVMLRAKGLNEIDNDYVYLLSIDAIGEVFLKENLMYACFPFSFDLDLSNLKLNSSESFWTKELKCRCRHGSNHTSKDFL
ncbi:MAG: hypothetical protein CM15mP59_5790 [Flavobacteriaceae bacterium]|nr:MAG: hypothetical protein CM15mP59_5790 [Flavobacteriaceae bacterium]